MNSRRILYGEILCRRECCRFSAPGQTHRRNRCRIGASKFKVITEVWCGCTDGSNE